ncbi:16S rRNA (guanine(966)-N(2))-methyltransferase RsmD [Desulfosoma sp.]
MRIIAGRFRGRTLAAPKTGAVRPTADRVREAVFSILGERVVGSRVLDLFAGTGALGLEALSRGACCAVFVDSHRPSVALIRANLERCGIQPPEGEVLVLSAAAAISRLAFQSRLFDLIFMDPPYGKGWIGKTLALLEPISAPDALVVAEHHEHDPVTEPFPPWQIADRRRYGTVAVTFFRRGGDLSGSV